MGRKTRTKKRVGRKEMHKKLSSHYATREEWLEARLDGIGGSDSAAILEVSRFKTPLKLWAEKVNRIISEPSEEMAERMEWGLRLEPLVAEKYVEKCGGDLIHLGHFHLTRHPDYPWMYATVDYLVERDGELILLECKTTNQFLADEWQDGVPLAYKCQVQHNMEVSKHLGVTKGAIAVLIGGQAFKYAEIEPNPKFVTELIDLEAEFLERVQQGDPPPATGKDSKLLGQVFNDPDDTTVVMDAYALEVSQEIGTLKAEIKERQETLADKEAYIKSQIRDNTYGTVPGWDRRWSWKMQERAGYTVADSQMRVLRTHKIKS